MNGSRESASQRVLRLMSAGIGLAAILFGAIRTPDALGDIPVFGATWSIIAASTFLLPIALMPALALWAPTDLLRALATTSGAGFVVAALIVIAGHPPGADLEPPWPFTVSALASSVVAIWAPRAVAFLYLVGTVALMAVGRLQLSPSADLRLTLLDATYTLLFNLVFVALAIAFREIAGRIDAGLARAIRSTQDSAAAEARLRERRRVDALVHDRVLSALLVAADERPAQRRLARSLADDALRALDDATPDTAPAESSLRDTMWRIQAVATELVPDADFTHDDLAHLPPLPSAVADALVEATAEALRNSLLHAGRSDGRPVARFVHVSASSAGVAVTVLDDGAGFDPTRVPENRLGIAISIRGRIEALPGGSVEVSSRPGVGTRVRLGWTRVD